MNPLLKKYYDESDYKLTLSSLYQVKHYLQKYSNDKFIEFNSSMTGLIEYILNIRSNQLPKSLYWSIDGLQTTSLKEIHLLFPDRVKDSKISLHNTEKTTSVEEKDIVMNESFHTTSRGIWNGHFLAIQKISSSSSKNIFHQNDIGLRECLNLLGNPIWKDSIYLISLLGFSYDNSDNLYFLYPLHSQRSLHDLFINATDNYKITLSIEQKLSILLDICHGIHFLHSNGIVHGRLKDTNIFLDSNNYRAKISDFGYQSYLSLSTRANYKGKHGIRWTAPEVIQLEKQFEEKLKKLNQNNTLSNTDYQKLENLLLKYGNCPLSPASDIYSIGILVLVLLTEKIPFFNVVHEEGVKGQLLSHQLPYIPSNFPDADVLSPLLDEVYSPCTAPVHQRPTMDQIKAIIESSYCNGIHRVYEKELRGYQEDMNNVKEEINDLIIKIKEHDELVKKGKEIISRKESDKINIMDSKIRREREVEIQKAKMKLVTFQEELEGLKEDKEGAEHDLGELQDLIVEVQKKQSEDKRAVLHQRPDMVPLEEDHVELETYCDDRDIVKIAPLYNPSAGGILTFSSNLAKASPLSSLYTEQFEISPNEAEQVVKDVQKNQFRFKHLADNLEIIFRVPVNFKSLISSSNNATKKPPSILQYEEPKPSANIVPISSYPTNLPPQRTVNAGYRQEALMSTASDDSSLIGFRAYRNQTQGKDSDDDSDDEDDEDDEVPNETVLQDEEYTDSQWHLSRATTTRVDRYFSTAPIINNTAKELVNDILSGTGWEIPISAPLVPKEVNDNFPSDDIDSLHVQYLAAVRGDWDESIGFRRLNEGIPDDMITAYLENDFTALHLAAFLGNYKILIEFIQQGGLNPSLCDSNGDTPLHCACKRGHYQIVLYLMEECGCSPYSKNQNGIIPIQYALKGGYLNIIEYMMEKATKRVAFNYIDDIFGASLLHWACLSTRVELVDYLIIKQNLKIDLLTNDNMTCLHWACYNSSIEVVKYLIENALADVRKKSNNGWSCLHFATASGSVEKATYLMDTVQLKLTDKDDNFKSPFDVAVGACLLYLQERKAKGFVTGSIAEKNRKEQSNSKEKN